MCPVAMIQTKDLTKLNWGKTRQHMKSFLLVFIILIAPLLTVAQQLKGKVTTVNGLPLQNATVMWLGVDNGTVTNAAGEFALNLPKQKPYLLLVSYVGYKTDTLQIDSLVAVTIVLQEQAALNNIKVKSAKRATYIAANPIKTEVISSLELKKAACCDLAGCFETQSTVQPQTTNIITNSKELRILGLSGIYNQVLIDGFPQVQGLTYTYGISSIPGPLVENIYVAKGANSVLQGFESISGQINVLTKEPDKTDKLLLNGYINSFGEKHLNAIVSTKKKKWSSLTAFHMVQPAGSVDNDDDTFLDLPLLTRFMVHNRWKKGDEQKWGWSTQFAIRYLNEQRIGGQTNFDFSKDKGTTNAYGQVVNISQPEAWYKTAYRLNETHRFSLHASGFSQQQTSYFGVTKYNATQTNGYANLQYECSYGNSNVLKSGFSYRHLSLVENIAFTAAILPRNYDGRYAKFENIPGLFAEQTMNLLNDKLTWIVGIRADHHNQFKWQVTPRTLLKYNISQNTTIRGSIGKGWRTANIFSENIGMLASSRNIIFAEVLQPEKAFNFGFNAMHTIKLPKAEWYFSVDFYSTRFQNQIFPDYDTDPLKAVIKNFTGTSVSNGFQAELSGTFYNTISAKLGYVYLDVYQVKNGRKEALPFNATHRLNGAASFMPLHKKWHIDVNMHYTGKQRLPNTNNNPINFQRPSYADPYAIVNTQFTYTFKKWEWYGGVENLFNFRQRQPLISWQNPFGAYFDTQFAWGPTRGRELYLGIRFKL